MKIAVFTSYFYHSVKEVHGEDRIIFGGAERYLVELCYLLQSLGHRVDVYQSLNQTIIDGDKSVRVKTGNIQKNYQGIPITCLSETDSFWSLSTNPRLNMIFNELAISYDVTIWFATFLCYPHVPVNSISISHGIFWDYTHHFIATCSHKEKEEWLRRNLVGFTSPDVCVAVDSNVRKVIAALNPGAEKRIQIIYNFVDTEKFTPKEKDWEGIRVLFPRRLTALRGCNEFIKVSQMYKDYQYISVGQALSKKINDVAKDYGDQMGNIQFFHKEMEGMEEVYQNADIAVVPTVACEGLSLSLLEAMSCGLPIVTTTVGGLGDAVIPGYNAFVYDPHHGGLGECIDLLAKNPDVREKMGKLNRDIVCTSFDIEIWKERWKRLISNFGG